MGRLDLAMLATFLFVMSIVWLLMRAMVKPRPKHKAEPLLGGASATTAADASDARSEAAIASLAAQLPQTLLAGEELDKDLRRAGYYQHNARERFFALRSGLFWLVVLATGIVVVAIGPEHQNAVTWTLLTGFLAAILSFTLPRIILAINAKRRVGRISAALPDALDTISMCLHGGISLQECVGYVGQEMKAVHPDLSQELLMVGQQTDINSFDFAIQQFAARIDGPEIVALAAMVTQNQRLGTGVMDSIRDLADQLRLKRRQMAEAKASRAELFLLFPVVFCLLPSILIILWGPPILSLVEFIQSPTSPIKMNP